MNKYLFPDESEFAGYEYPVFEIMKGEATEEKSIIDKNDIRDTFDAKYHGIFMTFKAFDIDIDYQKLVEIVDEVISSHRIIPIYKQIETKIKMFLSYLRSNWDLDAEEFANNLIVSLMDYQYKCTGLASDMIIETFGEQRKKDPILKEIFLKILFVLLTQKTEVSYDDEYIIYEKTGKDSVKKHILPEVLLYDALQYVKTPDEKIDQSTEYFVKNYLFK